LEGSLVIPQPTALMLSATLTPAIIVDCLTRAEAVPLIQLLNAFLSMAIARHTPWRDR
jgi:hypothetical protein